MEATAGRRALAALAVALALVPSTTAGIQADASVVRAAPIATGVVVLLALDGGGNGTLLAEAGAQARLGSWETQPAGLVPIELQGGGARGDCVALSSDLRASVSLWSCLHILP